MDKTPFRPIIRTQADLAHAWRRLMRPLARTTTHALWLMLIEPTHAPIPQLIEIADSSPRPDADHRAALPEFLRVLVEEGAPPRSRIAFLLTRPGTGGVSDDDRAWARVLYAAARDAGVPCEVVHVATADAISPIPADEVGLSRPA